MFISSITPDPVFISKNLKIILANGLWYPSNLRFFAISQGLSFKFLSETVLLAKSLLSEYAASWAKQALFNSFLCKKLNVSVSLSFGILSQCLGNGSHALLVNSDYFKCSSGINVPPANKNLLVISIILNYLFESSLFFLKSWFFLTTNSTIW